MKKFITLYRFGGMLRRIGKQLVSPHIPLWEKLLFFIPAVVYWFLPDAIPFVPVDDVAITLLLAKWFSDRAERKYGNPKG